MQLVRYQILFMIQLVMLLYDIFANAFSEYLGTSNVYMLVIYTLQDLLIITAAIALCLEFSSTFIFQAGLVGVVLSKFKGALISSAIYFLFCLGIHAWSLTVRWTNMMAVPSSTGYFLLFAAQRTCELSLC
ncbi:unnamed protein product [Calicophoron daubneyi]|uniref:Transmembrane protein 138 n=1 Tax=Calicophoron daubneyi TaxID=300641 RepID=A0AAV2TV94_CALDB